MASLEVRNAELESALRASEKQCDDLLADIANLCSQGGSGMFNPNYLLKERLDSAISEGRQLRQQLCDVKVDRESILEELQQARAAKISTERCAAELSERCKSLERDVTFYKERAVKAMAERDQEIENVRAEALRAHAELGELLESLQLAETSNEQLEERLSCLQAEVEQLRQQVAYKQQAASAELEAELRQLRDAVQHLEDGTQKLKTQLVEVQSEASHTHKLLKQAHKIEDQLTCQVRELQAELAATRRPRSSGSQSPQAVPVSPTGPSRAASAGGAATGAEADPGSSMSTTNTAAAAAGGRSPGARPTGPTLCTLPQSPSSASASSPTSPPACSPTPPASRAMRATAAAAAAPRSPAPLAGRRILSVSSATAITVSAAEAAAEEQQQPALSLPEAEPPAPEAVEALPPGGPAAAEAAAPITTHGSVMDAQARIQELEAALAQAREDLTRERAVHEDEHEQLQVLRTMAHDFKIKLAQATQEKVEALLKAAQLAQSVAAAGDGTGYPGLPAPSGPAAVAQRQGSMVSERNSRDLSHSPGVSLNLHPANSAPSAVAGGGHQSSARSLWTSWLGSGGSGWYGTVATTTGAGAAAASPSPSPYAPSIASEEGSEADNGGAAAAASAAAAAAAHAATVEAAEGRSRRLAAQLERVRSQLAVIDRMAGHVGRCEARLRSCAALLWSSREEDAPRRWAALSDLTRLAEECAALRTEAGLTTPAAAAAASPPAGPLSPDYLLPPVIPLALVADAVVDVGALRNLRQQPYPYQQQGSHIHYHPGNGGGAAAAVGAATSLAEYDSSVVCTREAGGVQRRVAEVLVGAIEFGVRSLEQYNHQSALTSVMYS